MTFNYSSWLRRGSIPAQQTASAAFSGEFGIQKRNRVFLGGFSFFFVGWVLKIDVRAQREGLQGLEDAWKDLILKWNVTLTFGLISSRLHEISHVERTS